MAGELVNSLDLNNFETNGTLSQIFSSLHFELYWVGIDNKPRDLLGFVAPTTIRAMVAYKDLFRIDPAFGSLK